MVWSVVVMLWNELPFVVCSQLMVAAVVQEEEGAMWYAVEGGSEVVL